MSKLREAVLAYLFLTPALVVLSIFTFWPIGFSFVLSFFKWDFRNMKSPYFYGLGNYKEILQFDYPVKFPFHVGLIYSSVYIGLAILSMVIVSEIFRISTKKKPSMVFYVALVLTAVYFVIRNNLNLTGSVFLVVVLGLFILIALRKKLFYKKFFEDHAWFAFLVWIVSYIVFEFRLSAGLNGEVFGVMSFFMDAAEKNLFFKALVNTTYYVVLTVPIGLTLALLIALLLNNDIKFRAVFRTAFFIPFVTSSVAVGLIWKWIYNDDVGLLNYFLSSLGLRPVRWLKDAKWTIPTVSIVSIWKNVGYNAIIFLAGLQNIDAFYYEAAEVDGANSWQKFMKITWPLLSPTTFFLVIVSVIGAFKVFQEVFVLYDGLPGPYGNSGMTMVYYVFDLFYRQQRMGIASAAAYLLFLIILAFTFIQYRIGNRVVEYVS